MNISKEKRFLALGITLGIIGTLTTGAGLQHRNEIGRFLLKTGGEGTAYVIDTITGQVWSRGINAEQRKRFHEPKAESRFPKPGPSSNK